jgi:4-amino-4-deoxy-L-arabinose transferase-like glycosyltransferase
VSAPAHPSLRLALWWGVTLLTASSLLIATRFRTHDPDSALYVIVASHLAEQPIPSWIAPQWWGGWNHQGPFREHPAGTFIPPALLTRLGVPGEQSSFIVGLLAQIVSLITLVALGSRLLPSSWARMQLWTLQLLPIAFVFRIRANHEYLLLAGTVVAVYAIERARERWAWLLLALAAFAYALLVKGIFGFLAPALSCVWLVMVPPREGARNIRGWVGVVLMGLVTPLIAVAYEHAYVTATGLSFFDYYMGVQLRIQRLDTGRLPFPINKLWNAVWYLGRIAWYAAPWSLTLLAARVGGPEGRRNQGAWLRFCIGGVLLTVGLLALCDTRADRYMFLAFYLAGAGGTVAAIARWPRVERLAERLDRTWPWGPAALWLALFMSRLVMG